MRYLIDTNVFIKMTIDTISDEVRNIIENYENIIYVSSESVKEFIHLVQAGKVAPKKEIRSLDVFDLIENTLGFNVKYITKEHLRTFAKLALVEGHNDPSDRLIISQALTEKIPLISSDTKFPKYRKQGLDLIINR
jgi:PIN domain nuclease of toxin-antitoxin system